MELRYINIRGLYGNLHDLTVASKGFDILFCSETLVSNFRHISELSSDSLTMPQSCFPEAELTTFAFSSGEVKKL